MFILTPDRNSVSTEKELTAAFEEHRIVFHDRDCKSRDVARTLDAVEPVVELACDARCVFRNRVRIRHGLDHGRNVRRSHRASFGLGGAAGVGGR